MQEARPPFIPEGAEVMTVIIEFPPGDPGTPPHRHPGPAFGYMLEGAMRLNWTVNHNGSSAPAKRSGSPAAT